MQNTVSSGTSHNSCRLTRGARASPVSRKFLTVLMLRQTPLIVIIQQQAYTFKAEINNSYL